MPFRSYTLTLTGSAQQLSGVFSAAEIESSPSGPAITSLSLQANSSNANPIWIGSSNVAANAAPIRLSSAVAGIPQAPWLREYTDSFGAAKLGDLWAIGTLNEKLHIGIDVE